MRAVYITTFDNPYDPADEFDEWFRFDSVHSYGTLNLLARLTGTGDESSESSQDEDIELAIDSILELDSSGFYVKIVKEEDD